MQTRVSLGPWFALAILAITVLYAVIDSQVILLLAEPMKAALGLSDTQVGSLRGVGAVLFASIAVVPLGWLADRMDRRLLLVLCILVWSVAVASCGLATNYWTLMICVAFLGAGEAGLGPIVFAMIPDMFTERQRMTANFIFYTATMLGSGIGIAMAGAIIQNIGLVSFLAPNDLFTRETWRMVFLVVGIPGPFLAVAIGLIRLKRHTPVAQPDAALAPMINRSKLTRHFTANWQAIMAVFVSIGVARLGAGAIFTWMPIILMRNYGLSAGDVGAGLGGAITVGSLAGLGGVGVIANYLRSKWGDTTPARLSWISYLVYGLLVPLYFFASTPNEFFLIATVQMAFGVGGSSLAPTMTQDLAPADLRGRFFAISTVVSTLFMVVSPLLVGLLSDHVFTETDGLMTAAVVVAFPSLILGALVLLVGEKHVFVTAQKVRALEPAA